MTTRSKDAFGTRPRGGRLGLCSTLGTAAIQCFQIALFSLLALLERTVLAILTAVAGGLLLLSFFFAVLNRAHPTHFPFGVVAALVVLSALTAAAYEALLYCAIPRANR